MHKINFILFCKSQVYPSWICSSLVFLDMFFFFKGRLDCHVGWRVLSGERGGRGRGGCNWREGETEKGGWETYLSGGLLWWPMGRRGKESGAAVVAAEAGWKRRRLWLLSGEEEGRLGVQLVEEGEKRRPYWLLWVAWRKRGKGKAGEWWLTRGESEREGKEK